MVFLREHPFIKWMMTGGTRTPISGNPHIYVSINISIYLSSISIELCLEFIRELSSTVINLPIHPSIYTSMIILHLVRLVILQTIICSCFLRVIAIDRYSIWRIYWHYIWHSIWHVFWHILTFYLAFCLVHSDIASGSLSGMFFATCIYIYR